MNTINLDADIGNNLYKNITLQLNPKYNFNKFKTINENIRNLRHNRNIEKNLNKNNRFIKISDSLNNDPYRNKLIINKNFLFSKPPDQLPLLNLDPNNKFNKHLNTISIKSSYSRGAIIDQIIEKSKKAVIPTMVKNFYENKKVKGYIPFIANKESNTLFLRKYHKKYNENKLHTEGNDEKILPIINKHMPLNKSSNQNN